MLILQAIPIGNRHKKYGSWHQPDTSSAENAEHWKGAFYKSSNKL